MINRRWVAGNVQIFRRILPLMVLFTAACDDAFGPGTWDATPDTVTLYSASRAEYVGFSSVVDITTVPVGALPLEAAGVTGNWDFALTEGPAGLELAPASVFAGLDSRARIAVIANTTLDAVRQAPRDTAQYSAQPVPIEAGNVYVVRSRRTSCTGASGYRYAKLRSVEIDETAGVYRFEIVRNPYCDNRSFIPPED
jgi:hypothetical protein